MTGYAPTLFSFAHSRADRHAIRRRNPHSPQTLPMIADRIGLGSLFGKN
ncbi:MAG: hypothetical protein ACP5D7_00855 [Limnospira sp.]